MPHSMNKHEHETTKLIETSSIESDLKNNICTSIEIEAPNELEVKTFVQCGLDQIRTSISTPLLIDLISDESENENLNENNDNEIKIEFQNEFNNDEDEEEVSQVNEIENNIALRPPLFEQSEILTHDQSIDLMNLCQFDASKKCSLIYRGTRDGFKARYFHFKCDGHFPTLTLLKAHYTGYIFGGYTEASWDAPTNGGYKFKHDPQAFLFSLKNLDNRPCIMRTNDATKSISCSASSGPRFGACGDLNIADNANVSLNSFSDLGDTYNHDVYSCGTDEAKSFLAGVKYFQLSEIEVFKIE